MDWRLILQSVIGGLLNGSLYGVAALGLALVFGVAKIVNLAHGAFIVMGMYLVYTLHAVTGIDPFVLVLPALLVGLAVGWAVQKVLLNRLMGTSQDGPLLVTLGLWIGIEALIAMTFGSNPKSVTSALSSATFSVGPANFYWSRLAVLALALAFTFTLYWVLQRTDLGRAIRAVSQDAGAAQMLGLSVGDLFAVTMAIGVSAAFFAGSLAVTVVPISQGTGTTLLLMSFVAAVLGGLGNMQGAFLGGVLIGMVEGISSLFLSGTLAILVVFVLFILFLLFRPEGLRRKAHA